MRTITIIISFLVLGPILVWKGSSSLILGMRAKSWPTAKGQVVFIDLDISNGRKGGKTYTPTVKYEYVVNGVSHTGDRIASGERSLSSSSDTAALFRRYQVGRPVTVHYDPKHPASAMLEVGTKGGDWIMLALGLLFSGIGGFTAWSKWRSLMHDPIAPASGF